jgi:aminoglycoside phosphotransferase (APT) family kinase protein
VSSTPDPRFTPVLAAIDPHATLVGTRPFAGGLSSQMTDVEFVRSDGTPARVVVRGRRPPEYGLSIATEFRLLGALRALGVRAPAPLLLDESLARLDLPYCVLEYVEAAPRMRADDGDADAIGRALAAELAAIHAIDGGRPEFDQLPRRADLVRAQLAESPPELDASLREAEARAALAAHWPPPAPARVALLHGDFWPGNVLWRGAEIAAAIDWENAAVGDPLADVATTRLDLLWAFGSHALTAFTTHYALLTGIDLANLPVWDLVATLRPAGAISVWAADWAAYGRPDLTASTMRALHREFLDTALDGLGRS